MGREGPKEKARQLYESGYGSLAKVAESLGEKVNTLKSWKKRDSDNGDPWVKLGAKKKQIVATKTEKVATKDKGATKKKKDELYINPDLTEKQRMFCAFYIQSFNATQSAIKAGYSKNIAKEIGYENLTKPHIKKEIKRLKEMYSEELHLDANRILNRHANIAMSDIKDYVSYGMITKEILSADSEGNPMVEQMEVFGMEMKESDEVDGTLIKKIKMGKFGIEFELEDRSKSLDFLTRYMGLEESKNDNKDEKDDSIKIKVIR